MAGVARLTVRLLGPVTAMRGEKVAELGSPKVRAVLTLLAAHADQVVSRDELVDGLWGDTPPARAEGAIYTYISALRRALEPDRPRGSASSVVLSVGSGYSLRVDRDAVDVHRFELHFERGQRIAPTDPAAAVRDFDAALSLWRGEPLSGMSGAFADAYRARLVELRIAAEQQRAEMMLRCGAHAEVIADLQRLVLENPLREALRGLLITALHRAGRRAEALAAYVDAREYVVERLGIEPGVRLTALYERIVRGADEQPAEGAEGVRISTDADDPRSADVPVAPEVLVGRKAEAAVVADAVEDVRAGRGGCLWVEGEPGIGKSALLAAVLVGASVPQVMWAAGDELSQKLPLQLLVRCLGISAASHDPQRVAVAAKLDAGLGDSVDPLPSAADLLVDLVSALCAERPLVLVIDDVHWADEASVLVLHRLVRLVRHAPLLLVFASSPAIGDRQLEQLHRAASVNGRVLPLAPLADEASLELVAAMVGAPAGPGLRGVVARAGGNPHFLREIVGTLAREGTVETNGGTADVVEGTTVRIPQSLVKALRRRLDVLSPGTVDVLRHAALLGVEFCLRETAILMGRPVGDLMQAVDEATSNGVLVSAGINLKFHHAVVQQALYDSIPAALRPAMHRDAAGALDGIGAPRAKVAAQIAAATAAADPWTIGWLKSNVMELADEAPELAVNLLRRLLAHETLGGEEREEFATALARLCFRLGHDSEDAARYVLARTREADLAAEMRWMLAQSRSRHGDLAAAAEFVASGLAALALPAVWRSALESTGATIATARGELAPADIAASAAVRHAAAAGDPLAMVRAAQAMWRVRTAQRDHVCALAQVDEALAVVRGRRGLLASLPALVEHRVFTLQSLDRMVEADETIRAVAAVPDVDAARMLQGVGAAQDYWSGRWSDAMTAASELAGSLTSPGAYSGLTAGAGALAAVIAVRRNNFDAAVGFLRQTEEQGAKGCVDHEHNGFPFAARAHVAERNGRISQAIAALEPLLRPGDLVVARYQWMPLLVRLAQGAGADDVCLQALRVCEEAASGEHKPGRATSVLERCRGLLLRDPEPIRRAAAHHRAVNRAVEAAEAMEDLAVVHAERGEGEDALTALLEAIAGYGMLGATWDLTRARARVHAHGVRSEHGAAQGWDALTAIERDVARLIVQGRADPEIALRLSLSRAVVQTHVERLLTKLGVKRRADVRLHRANTDQTRED